MEDQLHYAINLLDLLTHEKYRTVRQHEHVDVMDVQICLSRTFQLQGSYAKVYFDAVAADLKDFRSTIFLGVRNIFYKFLHMKLFLAYRKKIQLCTITDTDSSCVTCDYENILCKAVYEKAFAGK